MKPKSPTLALAIVVAGCATAGPRYSTGLADVEPIAMEPRAVVEDRPAPLHEPAGHDGWSPVLAVGKTPLTPYDRSPPTASQTIALRQPAGELHVVRPGDTLFAIAQQHLGSGGRWREIVDANPRLGEAGTVRPGQIVMLP